MTTKVLNKLSIYASRFLFNKVLKYHHFNNQQQRNLTISAYKSFKNLSEDSRYPKPFKFTDYDCIGFDLDNTICKYKIGPMLKMEYEVISKYLIENKNYSPKHLRRPIEDNLDFLMKGLILDFHNGNVLKINSNGKIVAASHGTKHLRKSEIEKQYGVNRHWSVTDTFAHNFLATWNGPLSEKMRSLLDYFDMPTALAFARLVDTLDEIEGKPLDKYDIWPDLLSALTDMYDINNFKLNKGGYFPNIKANPEQYIEKCSKDVIEWLKSLKTQNKVLFLITGSYVDFASLTSKTCMGENWKDLFDIIIFYAKKPGFFTANRPFLCAKTEDIVPGGMLERNGWYLQGNWKDLNKFLSTLSKKNEPRIAYVGDNLIQDVYTPAVHSSCDTVAICEELEAEGVFGFGNGHDHSEYLASGQWGSFFAGDDAGENGDSVWLNIIKTHSRLCAPNIDYFAVHPIDHEYKM